MSTAFIFPGQGSQSLGMLSTLAEQHSIIKETFQTASDFLGYDLWTLCQEGPADQLGQTEFTQPALLTAGVAVWRVWEKLGGTMPVVMAGHSLGEYTALTCAGALNFEDAVTLVQDRGRYMQSAVPAGEGAMAAIIGLDDEVVIDVCEKASSNGVVQAVNFNAPGQVVIAGEKQAIDDSVSLFKEAGAKRALPLPVSIPAHSKLMTPAAEKLRERITSIDVSLPNIPVVHNCNVGIATSSEEVRENLVTQLDSPVLWVKSVEKMVADFSVNHVVESGPGKVLCGMIKRISRETSCTAVDTPDAMIAAIS